MKVNGAESKSLSDAIDRITEGLENVVELYNESEEDRPLIQFQPEVITSIEKAKQVYGSDLIDKKINNVVKELLGWLSLDKEQKKDE